MLSQASDKAWGTVDPDEKEAMVLPMIQLPEIKRQPEDSLPVQVFLGLRLTLEQVFFLAQGKAFLALSVRKVMLYHNEKKPVT